MIIALLSVNLDSDNATISCIATSIACERAFTNVPQVGSWHAVAHPTLANAVPLPNEHGTLDNNRVGAMDMWRSRIARGQKHKREQDEAGLERFIGLNKLLKCGPHTDGVNDPLQSQCILNLNLDTTVDVSPKLTYAQ